MKHLLKSLLVVVYAWLWPRRWHRISRAERYGPLPKWRLVDRTFRHARKA